MLGDQDTESPGGSPRGGSLPSVPSLRAGGAPPLPSLAAEAPSALVLLLKVQNWDKRVIFLRSVKSPRISHKTCGKGHVLSFVSWPCSARSPLSRAGICSCSQLPASPAHCGGLGASAAAPSRGRLCPGEPPRSSVPAGWAMPPAADALCPAHFGASASRAASSAGKVGSGRPRDARSLSRGVTAPAGTVICCFPVYCRTAETLPRSFPSCRSHPAYREGPSVRPRCRCLRVQDVTAGSGTWSGAGRAGSRRGVCLLRFTPPADFAGAERVQGPEYGQPGWLRAEPCDFPSLPDPADMELRAFPVARAGAVLFPAVLRRAAAGRPRTGALPSPLPPY